VGRKGVWRPGRRTFTQPEMNSNPLFAGVIICLLTARTVPAETGAAVGREYDLLAADVPAAAEETAAGNVSSKPLVIQTTDGRCEITIHTRQAPELRPWAEGKLGPVLAEWYPKIVALLPSEGFVAPTNVLLILRPGRGVAETEGTRVTANSTWLQSEIGGEAIGALVHELVHVVQQYGRAPRDPAHPGRSPGWLVEGMADYIRWFRYEPGSHGADIVWMRKLRHFSPRYNAGYRVTANFLNWVTEHYDANLVTQLNAAMREGKYDTGLWKQHTGRTLQQLGDEWKSDVEAQRVARPVELGAGHGLSPK
jgi:hypothetical protein